MKYADERLKEEESGASKYLETSQESSSVVSVWSLCFGHFRGNGNTEKCVIYRMVIVL